MWTPTDFCLEVWPGALLKTANGLIESLSHVYYYRQKLTSGELDVGFAAIVITASHRGSRFGTYSKCFHQGLDRLVQLRLDLWSACTPQELHYASALAGLRGLVELWSGHEVTAELQECTALCDKLCLSSVIRGPWKKNYWYGRAKCRIRGVEEVR